MLLKPGNWRPRALGSCTGFAEYRASLTAHRCMRARRGEVQMKRQTSTCHAGMQQTSLVQRALQESELELDEQREQQPQQVQQQPKRRHVQQQPPARAAPASMLGTAVPISVLTDTYKASHWLQYPKTQKMVAVSVGKPPSGVGKNHAAALAQLWAGRYVKKEAFEYMQWCMCALPPTLRWSCN